MKAHSFRPIGPRVLLRPIEPPTVSPGGIVIPECAREASERAVVIAIGDGDRTDDGCGFVPIELKVGQTVAISGHVGDEVEVDGENFIVMLAGDILGVLENG